MLNLPDPVDFKYVDIVFENCNAVRIPSRMVEYLNIRDVRKDIFTNFCQQFIVLDYCTEVDVTIWNKALNIETDFQKSHDSDYRSSFEHHLKVYKDITHIGIKPNKGKYLYIGVPYKPLTECGQNPSQTNEFNDETFTISIKG